MASGLGVESEANFTMNLFASDLASIPILQSNDRANDIAMGATEIPPSDKQLGMEPKLGTENIPAVHSTINMKPVQPSAPDLGQNEPAAETATSPSFDKDEIDIVQIIFPVEAEGGCTSNPTDGPEPAVLIDAINDLDKMRLMVIVSMVTPFGDGADTLVYAGDFIIEVTSTTTIREIKYGITSTLDICYEDMALVFVGKFLSDARTIAYYFIDDGQTLHLLVESPNKLFKDVFEEFKRLNLSEERAWFATRSFIHILHNKYSVDGSGDDETPTLTEELLLQELDQIYVPGTDESDDSSAEEDEPAPNDANLVIVGTMELEFVAEETDEDDSDEEEDLDENHNSDDEHDNSEAEDENSQDGEDNDEDDDEDESDFEKHMYETELLISQAIAIYTSMD